MAEGNYKKMIIWEQDQMHYTSKVSINYSYMKPKEEKKNITDIHMNTKLIHYDQCYYNEHKINSSQWNTQSTTYLLYLLTKK